MLFMSIPIVLVDYRDKKILKRLYCSTCSPIWILAADMISSAVMAVLSALLVAAAAILFFGYRFEGNILAFIGAWILTMVSMFSIGPMISSLCRTVKEMNVATSLVYFPMLFLSGATVPYELFPGGIRMVADVMPFGIGIKMMKAASVEPHMVLSVSTWSGALVLVTIAMICSAIQNRYVCADESCDS